jgi:selenide,water dikinase
VADGVTLAARLGDAERALLCDPQTSGGLLVSCSPDSADAVLEVFRQHGHTDATVIGAIEAGPAGVRVD